MEYRRSYKTFAAALVVASLVASCGDDDSSSESTSPASTAGSEATVATETSDTAAATTEGSASDEEIRVLLSAPLTGDSAEFGVALQRGAELAADTINASEIGISIIRVDPNFSTKPRNWPKFPPQLISSPIAITF